MLCTAAFSCSLVRPIKQFAETCKTVLRSGSGSGLACGTRRGLQLPPAPPDPPLSDATDVLRVIAAHSMQTGRNGQRE